MKNVCVLIVCACLFLGAASRNANAQQNTATTTANVGARIVTAISISKDVDMDFGDVVTGGTIGTVVLSAAASPTRTPTGGTTLGNNTTVAAGAFTVSGQAASTYAITLPSSPVTITTGADDMTVDTFTSTPSGTGVLNGGGTQALYVGATLHVGANQVSGTYTGTFDVTVTYN